MSLIRLIKLINIIFPLDLAASLKNEISTAKMDYHKVLDEHNEVLAKGTVKEVAQDSDYKEAAELKLKVKELEGVKNSLEREMASIRIMTSTDQSSMSERIQKSNQVSLI